MKKVLSVVIVCVLLLSCLPVFSAAGTQEPSLPFELVAPANVSVIWLEGNDSPTTMQIAYGLSNEMTSFFSEMDEASLADNLDVFMSQYDYDEIWMNIQIDWALDDVNDSVSGWHHNAYWDGVNGIGGREIGCDNDYNWRLGPWDVPNDRIDNITDTVNQEWITRGVSEDDLNGNAEAKTPGLKDQLYPGQYSYHDDAIYIDYTEHTAYFRARFAVTTCTNTDDGAYYRYYYSDWSNVAGYGKDFEAYVPLTSDDLTAPEITDLRMTDKEFNGQPIVAFTLTVPDDLTEKATNVAAAGGVIWILTETRVIGEEEWILMSNAEYTIQAGEMECPLITLVSEDRPTIPKDINIELRCRYVCYQSGVEEDVYSAYSDAITFNTGELIPLLGDIDGDGNVTILDATYIQRKLASLKIPFEINEKLADTDEDGFITILDATFIQRWLVNLPSNDRIGKPLET